MATNMSAFFKTMFESAYDLNERGEIDESDDLLFRLLAEPTCPLLYRAGANLLLCDGYDRPVEFAEAVKWYTIMYEEVQDDPENEPHYRGLLEQAQKALEDAKERVAKEAAEGSDEQADDDDDEEGNHDEEEPEGAENAQTESQQTMVATEEHDQEAPTSSFGGSTTTDNP